MALPGGDRIKELSNTSGTGSFVLTGAVAGEPVRAFGAAEDGQVIRFVARHVTAQEAESGYGVYTHGTRTLTRLYRYYPTKGGSAVSFSAGGVHVAATPSVGDFLPNLATANPTVNDDVTTGFLQGHRWINTTTGTVWACTDHTDGAAVWVQLDNSPFAIDQYEILARLVAGTGLPVGIGVGDITEDASPATGDWILGFDPSGAIRKYNVGNLPTGSGDVAPSQVSSNAAEYVLTLASRMHTNSEVRSHQANVDFEVPATAAAGSKWLIKFLHDGCTVSVDGDAGSVNGTAGGSARGVNGGVGVVEVDSNAGSAPVVLVRGNVLVPPIDVGGTKTYDNDDSGLSFRLTSTALQTFSAAANYSAGFYVSLFKESDGTTTLDGVDANYNMTPTTTEPAVATVAKIGTALVAFGSDGTVLLDAA